MKTMSLWTRRQLGWRHSKSSTNWRRYGWGSSAGYAGIALHGVTVAMSGRTISMKSLFLFCAQTPNSSKVRYEMVTQEALRDF
jgi:hypothetical protein